MLYANTMNKLQLLLSQNKLLIFFGGLILILGGWFLFSRETEPTSSSPAPETKLMSLKRGVEFRSNTWFSSLYHGVPSAPLFVLPGAYQWTREGLAVGAPQAVGTANTVFGSFAELCNISDGNPLVGVAVLRYGDFDVLVQAKTTAGVGWQAHFMEGSPTVALSNFKNGLKLACKDGVSVEKETSGVWVVKQGERNLFFIQTEAPLGEGKESLQSSQGKFRIMQWPTVTEKSIDFFLALPWSEVEDTQIQVETMSDTVSFRLVALAKEEVASLMTVWPHHRLATEYPKGEALGSYESVLGRLDLQLVAELPLRFSELELPETFIPIQDGSHRQEIMDALKADVLRYQEETKPEGVYFGGAWLGGLATLTQLADAYRLEKERGVLLDLLEKYLLESVVRFKYDESKKMMVATNTEFGNEKGNDHHFHYGYYLRAAAVLLQFKPELGVKLKPTMEELTRDIATTDRTSTRFPYLRHFDPYAGHSWADGEARFADGNNQESTSEALNAWYALYLWSQVMGDTERTELFRALYSYELMGTRAYWFGEGNPFPMGFEHKMASLIWGGKRDYATWFSGEAMHIHGIQWLPITPAAGYLGSLPDWESRKQEILRTHPNPASHEWGDLYTATLSFHQPEEALRLLPEAQKNRAMKSTAILLHTVYSNLENSR